jgi:ankyrin repeat protein
MTQLQQALGRGDPREVAELIAGGEDIHYKREHGYTALLDAVHGRDVSRDVRLLDLLALLVANRVNLKATSSYHESALRVLSRVGRFDAVRLLLDAGADEQQLAWTPLMRAVAIGSIGDVERELDAGAALEATDWWHRTAFAIALMTGDMEKIELLFDRGANADVVGRIAPALFYAIDGHHPHVVRWLVDVGAEVDDGFKSGGVTPLMHAAEQDAAECVDVLIAAGADVDRYSFGTALNRARTRPVVASLLAAGSNPKELSNEGRRAFVGLPPDPDPALMTATPEDFRRAPTRRFGRANPEAMNEPFWLAMIRSGLGGYSAGQIFAAPLTCPRQPIWCAERFGQSLTVLPDGRVVLIGGEHEDFYDPDFCIYNDVFVHRPDGSIDIFGYPEDIFAPTDFHSATLVGGDIYVIGSLGYQGTRRFGETPVVRVDTTTFRMERLATSGDAPGWIFQHRAALSAPREIRVWGGSVAVQAGAKEKHQLLEDTFILDLDRLTWRRASGQP